MWARPAPGGSAYTSLRQQPAAVDREVDTVDGPVLEQEGRRVDDFLGADETAERRPARTASSTAGGLAEVGVSPTIPGWIAFTLTGASSIASDLTMLEMPPLTVVIVVEPG